MAAKIGEEGAVVGLVESSDPESDRLIDEVGESMVDGEGVGGTKAESSRKGNERSERDRDRRGDSLKVEGALTWFY